MLICVYVSRTEGYSISTMDYSSFVMGMDDTSLSRMPDIIVGDNVQTFIEELPDFVTSNEEFEVPSSPSLVNEGETISPFSLDTIDEDDEQSSESELKFSHDTVSLTSLLCSPLNCRMVNNFMC